jgi:hypothetical protein
MGGSHDEAGRWGPVIVPTPVKNSKLGAQVRIKKVLDKGGKHPYIWEGASDQADGSRCKGRPSGHLLEGGMGKKNRWRRRRKAMSSAHPDSKSKKPKMRSGKMGLPLGYAKARTELATEIEKQMPLKERVEKVVALAKGLKTKTSGGDVYEKAPDLKALEFLESYKTGRPVNVLETDDDTKTALACIIIPAQRPR